MTVIMIVYYVICIYLIGILLWNFSREEKNRDDMLLYLIVLIPLILRILRVK
jgi:hypothetical protein